MRALESITGHVIYNPTYTYKFQLKTTLVIMQLTLKHMVVKLNVNYVIIRLNSEEI